MDAHLSDHDIAAAVDGRLDDDGRRHLKTCRRCLAAFSEAAEVGADWMEGTGPERALAPERVLAPERALAPERRPVRRLRWAVPAGLAAAALVVWAFLELPSDASVFRPSATLVAAAERYESTGYRLPRTSGHAPVSPSRGADETDPSRILAAADSLTTLWAAEPSEDIGYWRAAGLLMGGQVRAARLSLEEALGKYPHDADLLILRGALAYRDGENDAARSALQEALRTDPGSVIAAENLARLGGLSP